MFIEPFNRFLMFIADIADNPDNNFSVIAGRISDNFTQMIMIRIFKLIFYDDFSSRSFFLCQNINHILSDIGFGFKQFNINADFFTQSIKIILLGEPSCKIKGFMAPHIAQIYFFKFR